MNCTKTLSRSIVFCFFLAFMITAVVAGSSSCDSASSGSPIVNIYPWHGLTGVSPDFEMVVQFNTSLNPAVFGTIGTHGRQFSIGGGNCTMTMGTTNQTNDTVYVVPSFSQESTTFEILYVYGFEDSNGNTIASHTDKTYEFTVR